MRSLVSRRQQWRHSAVAAAAVAAGGRTRSGIRRGSASFPFLGGLCISVAKSKREESRVS